MVYELIIVGGSASAVAAGIYAARRKLNFIIISKDFGGEVANSGEIENYPGFVKTTGIELSEKFKKHLASHNVFPETGIEVKNIKQENNRFILEADKIGKAVVYEAKSVIIATGVRPRQLGIPGEEKFRGKGVSYCTVCDGPLFRNKIVATIGGGNSALESVLMLSQIASKVYLITINSELAGENTLIDKVKADKKIEIICNVNTKKIIGEQLGGAWNTKKKKVPKPKD